MKKILMGLTALALCSLISCGTQSGGNYGGGNVIVQSSQPQTDSTSMGLDLQALGEMVKKSPDAKTLEQQLNTAGGINNLDLDKDGKTDYITVKEYAGQNGNRGFSFIANLNDGTTQEVATVEVQPPAQGQQQATMNISGNQNVYGNGCNYSANYDLADLVFYSYLFAPHWSPYYSPYHYGYYPSYYHSYYRQPYGYYSRRMGSTYGTTTHIRRTTTTTYRSSSPYTSSASSKSFNNNRSLSSGRSQKSFSTTTNSHPSTSGFKSSSSSGSSSSKSSSRSFGGSSSRSFGGGSHSGGGRHR